jgi:plastocyanin
MLRLRTPAAAAALVLAAAPLAAAAPAPNVVTIANFTFSPPVITVKPGTTVTWVNGDDIPHTVVSTDQAFKSKVLDTDGRFAFTFQKPGTYAFFCSIHPQMTGKVVVKGP